MAPDDSPKEDEFLGGAVDAVAEFREIGHVSEFDARLELSVGALASDTSALDAIWHRTNFSLCPLLPQQSVLLGLQLFVTASSPGNVSSQTSRLKTRNACSRARFTLSATSAGVGDVPGRWLIARVGSSSNARMTGVKQKRSKSHRESVIKDLAIDEADMMNSTRGNKAEVHVLITT
ncbi:hypothetical protein GT037_003306 [Alternaria burnsii]|uniref:Uncharacterized protein n=1 Tax=Alternaria burnsii TaxID=1187904 RepID=A0A8H7B8E6_9PLEO|nr:uncharacterized protein GT037_003306 [Alternaria burnsii]KAF7679558.1 hypothetical protein GT037_003306 [Alternaria burnsii]